MVDECGTTCSQLVLQSYKYITKQQNIPSCNFVDYYMCGNLLYHYRQHTHTLCVCAGLYVIEDLCSLPFCAIVRVGCVVCVATKATEIQVELIYTKWWKQHTCSNRVYHSYINCWC